MELPTTISEPDIVESVEMSLRHSSLPPITRCVALRPTA